MTKIASRNGYEVFAKYDRTAGVYELFASDTGQDYIGCADSLSECRAIANEWIDSNTTRTLD